MSRVADALKRAGQLQRDLPVPGTDRDSEFVSEGRSRTAVRVDPPVGGPVPRPLRPAAVDRVAEPPAAVDRVAEPLLPALSSPLLLGQQVDAAVEEEYRILGAALQRAKTRTGIRTLLVSSAVPQEGKTLSTANVALALSQSYRKRVLVIDADLRKPALHGLLGVERGPGLSDVLLRGMPLAPLRIRPSLWFLPAGSPQPDAARVLADDRMKSVLEQVSREYDWVLLDLPPAGVLPDAQLLLQNVDAAVLVVRAGHTPYDQCRRAAHILSEGGKLLGVVLNAGKPRSGPSDYGSYTERQAF